MLLLGDASVPEAVMESGVLWLEGVGELARDLLEGVGGTGYAEV